jgi:hypothetical protein
MAAVTTSSALETITDYINDARVLLQDTIQPYRYDDTSLLTAMNVTLLEGRRIRADLFVYNKKIDAPSGVQFFPLNDGSRVLIEGPFRLAFLHGLIAHALERDQEDIQDDRAAKFMAIFNNILVGRSAVMPQPAVG